MPSSWGARRTAWADPQFGRVDSSEAEKNSRKPTGPARPMSKSLVRLGQNMSGQNLFGLGS